jgi:hypothetical protein
LPLDGVMCPLLVLVTLGVTSLLLGSSPVCGCVTAGPLAPVVARNGIVVKKPDATKKMPMTATRLLSIRNVALILLPCLPRCGRYAASATGSG